MIPDTGGVSVLHEMCGPGVVADMVLTGRIMEASEALGHGIVSRVVTGDELDGVVRQMAEAVAAAPAVTVKLARRVISHLSRPAVRASMEDELFYQTFPEPVRRLRRDAGGPVRGPRAPLPGVLR